MDLFADGKEIWDQLLRRAFTFCNPVSTSALTVLTLFQIVAGSAADRSSIGFGCRHNLLHAVRVGESDLIDHVAKLRG